MKPSENKLQFKIGETKIGEAEVTIVNGEKRTVPVYYGNITNYMVDKKLVCINEQKYQVLFKKFLEENKNYEIPTDQEHYRAIDRVKYLIERQDIEIYNAEQKSKKKLKSRDIAESMFASDLNDSFTDEDKEAALKVESAPKTESDQAIEQVIKDEPRSDFKEEIKQDIKQPVKEEPKQPEVVISQDMYDKFLDVMKKVEEEEKQEKENVRLKNRIAELEKKNKNLDTSLKKEKIQKNKEFNEKLDDILFSTSVTLGLILTVLVFIYIYLQSLVG